jgi:Fur family transcriptional regulator, ferric uptake regulator
VRSTRQRAAIAEALDEAAGFLSAQELHDSLRAHGHRVGLTTVYRALQVFADAGEVDVIRKSDGETMYRRCGRRDHHHHLVCRSCGRSFEVEGPEVETWTARVARRHGFTSVSHTVELSGLCAGCSVA